MCVDSTDIYEYLPHSNCKRCGEENCLAFADKLVKKEMKLSSCGPLRLEEQAAKRKAIENLLNRGC